MDSEQYYDSLDEDSNCGNSYKSSNDKKIDDLKTSSKLPVKVKVSKRDKKPDRKVKSSKKNKEAGSKVKDSSNEIRGHSQEDDIIPLYDKNLRKVELNKFYKSCNNVDEVTTKPKRRVCKKKTIADNKVKGNSYLDMFHKKIGVEKLELSSRATCTNLTQRSYVTCENFDMSSSAVWPDIESMYLTNEDKICVSLASIESQLHSFSEQNLKLKIARLNYTNKCPKMNAVTVPELGKLGPDIPTVKLEKFKKRQEYGQMVSQKNKIKMMETKLLRNLEQEIKKCNQTL